MVRIWAKTFHKILYNTLKSDKIMLEHVLVSACHFCFIEVLSQNEEEIHPLPYCGGTAVLRDASYVYGGASSCKRLYVCQHYPSCDAYVGVHKGTQTPKGTLADGDLRNLRIRAHRMFDMIWKNGILTRKNAYRWIQDKFSLRSDQAHIGNFSANVYICGI